MQDVNHALANLRDQTGISTLDFDPDGNLTLIFNGAVEVNIARVDDAAIELWIAIDGLGRVDDQAVLRRVLEANHLGDGTGPARFALAQGRLVLCERVDVRSLDDRQFADRIVGFLKHGEFWHSGEAAALTTGHVDAEEAFHPDAFAIRV